MKALNIVFIGAGNMANSIIQGLLAQHYPPQCIWATNTRIEQLEQLKALNINTTTDNRKAAQHADILILSVKPQVLKKVVIEIAPEIDVKKPLIISVAAAITLATLEIYLKNTQSAIIRAMPNTPALLNSGATGLFANANCTDEQKDLAESIFRSVGIVVWLKAEKDIDAVAAISGSGPAYFFLFMDALQQAGIDLGLSKEMALLLSLQTALGATRMAMENNEGSLHTLMQNVASRGGTTQAALEVFEKNHFSELVKKAVFTAHHRAEVLAAEFKENA